MGADGYCRRCYGIADVTPVASGALLCDACLEGKNTQPSSVMGSLLRDFEDAGGITYSQEGDRNPEKGSTDCSGWVSYLSAKGLGVEIPKSVSGMYDHFDQNGALYDDIQVNDVIFWPGHVGMYLGRRHIQLDNGVVETMGLTEKNCERTTVVDINKMDAAVNMAGNAKQKAAWQSMRNLLNGSERYYYKDGKFYYEGPVVTQASSSVGKVIVAPVRYTHKVKFSGEKPFGRSKK